MLSTGEFWIFMALVVKIVKDSVTDLLIYRRAKAAERSAKAAAKQAQSTFTELQANSVQNVAIIKQGEVAAEKLGVVEKQTNGKLSEALDRVTELTKQLKDTAELLAQKSALAAQQAELVERERRHNEANKTNIAMLKAEIERFKATQSLPTKIVTQIIPPNQVQQNPPPGGTP